MGGGLVVASAQGIDVSNWQGAENWAAQKGLSFGIFRVTQGLGASGTNSPDPEAAHNHSGIAAQSLVRLGYHFNDAALSGPAQATYFVSEFTKLGISIKDGLILDHESIAKGLSPAQHAHQAVGFMNELEKLAPANPKLVYTFINFIKEGYCAGLDNWDLYLADPAATAPTPPPPWHRWTMWQWGQKGVDRDAFNGTAEQLKEWVSSFHPGVVRYVADGSTSLDTAIGRIHVTVGEAARRTVQHASKANAVDFVNYLVVKGPKADMPKGLVYYA